MGWLLSLSLSFYGVSAQNALKISSKTSPHDTVLLKQYDSLASAYLNSEELDSMYFSIQKGLILADKSKNDHYRGIFFFQMAQYFKRKYQADSGIIYARKAIPILQRHQDKARTSCMMYRLSTLYLDKQDQISAVKVLDTLLRFNEKYNEHKYTGHAYNLLAHIFRRLNDTLNEKKYIQKVLDWAEHTDSDEERVYAFQLWATFLVSQKRFQAAHVYYNNAYAIAKHQKKDEMHAELLLDMGVNFIALKNYKRSLETFRLAEKIALKHLKTPGWSAMISTGYGHISSLFLAMGKPEEALDYARRSFALVKNEPFRYEQQIQALKNQVLAQKALGSYQEALQSYEQLQKITNIFNSNKTREIAKDIEAKYQLEKSKREKELSEQSLQIKNLELQNEQKQGRILSILLGVLAISLGAGAWFFSKTQAYNQRLSKKKQQLEALNETKDKLFGIIGHDLRASAVNLNSTLTLLEQKGLTQLQLSAHTAVLRKKINAHQTILNNLLYWALSQRQVLWANPRLISLKDNMEEALESLHGLMQEKSLRTQWLTLSADRIYADENHLQIVLYNIIHNAIKFSPYGGLIQISLSTVSDKAVLHLTNRGEKFEWEGTDKIPTLKESHRGTSGEKGTGLGLLVCAELMTLNQGSIRAYSTLEATTTLELTFPLIPTAPEE